MKKDMALRISESISIQDDGCWVWQKRIDRDGYGRISYRQDGKKKVKAAHRVSYEEYYGVIPIGLQLDHLCRNRACVNPSHLEPVTPKENKRRSNLARKLDIQCQRGHRRSESNTYVTPTGGVNCKICRDAGAKRYMARRRAVAIAEGWVPFDRKTTHLSPHKKA